MVKLLKCEEHAVGEEFLVRVDQLLSLEEVGMLDDPDLPEIRKSMRGVDKRQVERLMFSDPDLWPPIAITMTDKGWVIVDGLHRREAMRYKGVKEINAICQEFESEIEVLRAAYRANRGHGLPIPPESRSAYAYVLHVKFPKMTQEEIGEEAGISQPTVSAAITRRDKKAAATAGKGTQEKPVPSQPITPVQPAPEVPLEERERESGRRDWQTITRDVLKLREDTKDLDTAARRAILIESLGNIQDRDGLLEIANLIREVLAPPAPVPPAPTPKRTPRKKPS